ncbi:MAG: hypothetical protein NC433_09760 [Clostridiales bacterium]|nr:hypothetical protein [Clostridiales bacterium]
MKKSIKTIGIIATMGFMLVCAYLLGITQAEIITEIQTVTEIKEVIPDGYIRLDDSIVDMDSVIGFSATEYGLQLYFDDGAGYLYRTVNSDI